MASSLRSTAMRACRSPVYAFTSFRGLVTLSARSRVNPLLPSCRRYDHILARALKEEPVNLDPGEPVELPEEPESHKKNDSYNEQPTFASLRGSISDNTLKALTHRPFTLTHMSPVQAAVLPLLPKLSDPHEPSADADASPPRDLLVKAKTGTGKTLAFLVPAIEARLKAIERAGLDTQTSGVSDPHARHRAELSFARQQVGTLIISPTRELATQIANEAIRASFWHKGFEVRLFTGGASKRNQMRDWMKGRRDIVVATPGRLRDLLHTEPEVAEGIRKTQILVLDEADTLLEMGFRDDIDAIIDFLPKKPVRQTFLFSATLSPAIQQIARAALDKKHTFIDVVPVDSSPVHAHVPQYHTVLPTAEKQIPHILNLIAHDQLVNPGRSKIMIFFPTTKMTQLFSTLLGQLAKTTLPAGTATRTYEIHSKRTQESRSSVSDAFRSDKSGASILITSDVSARGVDYPGVTRVIQVGIPGGTELYVHRVGRTGRAGTSGRGDLVLLPWEIGFVSWQLTDVPLKPLTFTELDTHVKELAKKYDEEPDSFWKGLKVAEHGEPQYDRTGRKALRLPTKYPQTLSPMVEETPTIVSALLDKLDESAVRETVGSMLGYYIAKSPELRVQKPVIVKGLMDWSVQALGLPQAPVFSQAFLERLGFSDGRTKHFGRAPQRDRRMDPRQPHWMGRGTRASREDEGERRGWDSEGGDRFQRNNRTGGGERFPRHDRSDGDRFSGGDRPSGGERFSGGDRPSGGDRFSRDDPRGEPSEYRSKRYDHGRGATRPRRESKDEY